MLALLASVADPGILGRLAQPWASFFNDSPRLQTVMTFAHLAGIFLGGGFAIATDRETLLAMHARETGQYRQLQRIHTIHRPVLVGLTIAIVSGFLLFAADVDVFLHSAAFWIKMALLGLLLANGFLLQRTEQTLLFAPDGKGHLWKRLGYISGASIALWLCIILVGTLLMNI
jgi:small-conductance mechanosensitive channel